MTDLLATSHRWMKRDKVNSHSLFRMRRSVMVALEVVCVYVCEYVCVCLARDRGSVNMAVELCQPSSGAGGRRRWRRRRRKEKDREK